MANRRYILIGLFIFTLSFTHAPAANLWPNQDNAYRSDCRPQSPIWIGYWDFWLDEIPLLAVFRPIGLASAGVDDYGVPAIFFNPIDKKYASYQAWRFLLKHECAHHLLGHVKEGLNSMMTGQLIAPSIALDAERAADCYAASEMVLKENWRVADAEILFGDILNYFQVDQYHDLPAERARRTKLCFERAFEYLEYRSKHSR